MFRATSPSERGELKSKGGGRKTIHYNGSEENIELILRTMSSVTQLSFCGAVEDLCENSNTETTPRSSTSPAQGDLLQIYFETFAERHEDQQLSKLCKDAGSSGWDRTDLHHNWWRRGNYADSISRIHTTSICENIQTKGVDSFKHKNWSRIGCESMSSRRTLWSWYHVWIVVWRPNGFMGSDCEWYQQIRHRNVSRNPYRRWSVHWHREACGKDQAKTQTNVNQSNSNQWKEVDRHWNTTIRSKFFWSVKIHDQNAATWSVDSSRSRWGSEFWRLDRHAEGKICWVFVMDSRQLGKVSGKKRRTKEKVSILLESLFIDKIQYVRAIQGHSVRNLVDPPLQDNFLVTRWRHRV